MLFKCRIVFITSFTYFPGLRFMSALQGKSWPSPQNGAARLRSRRWIITDRWRSQVKSNRSEKAIDSKMHSISGACMPVSRCKLPSTILSEDEACCDAYQELQEENSWRMSNLQTAYCALLLSCETLQREQMSCSVLSQHQTEVASTESGSKVNT